MRMAGISSPPLSPIVSRDATAIHAREKAEPKPKRPPEAKGGKRGRRRKDAPPAPPPEPNGADERRANRHLRGPVKVATHLAFGLVVIAAEQMLRMLI